MLAHAPQTDALSMPSDPDKDGNPPALNDAVAAGQQDRQDQQVSYPNGLNQPPLGLQPVNDKVAPATSGATVIGSRRRRSVAITVLMLALIAIVAAVYFLDTQPVQPPQKSVGATPSSVAPSVAQSSAGAARTVPPLPVTDAQIKPRQALPIVNECSQAVATLGLCSPATNQEKP